MEWAGALLCVNVTIAIGAGMGGGVEVRDVDLQQHDKLEVYMGISLPAIFKCQRYWL